MTTYELFNETRARRLVSNQPERDAYIEELTELSGRVQCGRMTFDEAVSILNREK